ncbi:hypothetical protein [Mucilaginibacter flavus]|uniref:hypothetical protein n=1 Tax=Mucilaginibacter flavus TaxID=931504 RepID=UPI0025B3EABD|nr:hypothetical protein [Mucilaginibacter flavus]MDN3581755.1 hypothetical protein [Mucilaginibacter flavus]
MKKTVTLFVCFLSFVTNSFAQSPDSLKRVYVVLDKTEQYIKHLKNITYKASYKSINSGQEDSIFTASGQVWMQQLLSDSIFGSTLHIKGETKGGVSPLLVFPARPCWSCLQQTRYLLQ